LVSVLIKTLSKYIDKKTQINIFQKQLQLYTGSCYNTKLISLPPDTYQIATKTDELENANVPFHKVQKYMVYNGMDLSPQPSTFKGSHSHKMHLSITIESSFGTIEQTL
jgi:hypothetical protein